MSHEPAFTIVDTSGNTLHFDRFAYERSVEAARGDYYDANWVSCRITLQVGIGSRDVDATLKRSVHAELLTTEITALKDILRASLVTPAAAKTFKTMEAYIELHVARRDQSIDITARLDLAPAIGPVVEFTFECRPDEIESTVRAIEGVQEAFPERNVEA